MEVKTCKNMQQHATTCKNMKRSAAVGVVLCTCSTFDRGLKIEKSKKSRKKSHEDENFYKHNMLTYMMTSPSTLYTCNLQLAYRYPRTLYTCEIVVLAILGVLGTIYTTSRYEMMKCEKREKREWSW